MDVEDSESFNHFLHFLSH